VIRIHYLHSANVQIPSANGVQTMHMCAAFAKMGAEVALSYPQYLWGNVVNVETCHDYYAVERVFPLRALMAPFTAASMEWPWYLPAAKLFAYSIETLRDTVKAQSQLEIVYTRCATAALTMPLLRRIRRTKPLVVFEAHEYPRDKRRAQALLRVDAIVAITRAISEQLQSELGYPSRRILVAPDGVADDWLHPIDRDIARQRLNLAPKRPLVVFTGKLHEDIVPTLIELADGLKGFAELLIVGPLAVDGSGTGLASLQALADQRGLDARFVGGVGMDKVRLYQSSADFLVAPYSGALRWARYTSPLKIFEYAAVGKPMVVSDLPVLHEVLDHGQTCWFVPPADGKAIADGIKILLGDPLLASAIAQRARQMALRFTWSQRARTILDFLSRRDWEVQ
jgi:glycosyltransferase involved in cell wall biosynthesis